MSGADRSTESCQGTVSLRQAAGLLGAHLGQLEAVRYCKAEAGGMPALCSQEENPLWGVRSKAKGVAPW